MMAPPCCARNRITPPRLSTMPFYQEFNSRKRVLHSVHEPSGSSDNLECDVDSVSRMRSVMAQILAMETVEVREREPLSALLLLWPPKGSGSEPCGLFALRCGRCVSVCWSHRSLVL